MMEEISQMHKLSVFMCFITLIVFSSPVQAQRSVQPDSLGLPGDNLNLYAVLKIFQESPTLEEFEKKLNAEELRINNLDLDGDGKIDYIRVVDHVADNVHDIVLQVPVTGTESQDVAVIQVETSAENAARVQIIGDEALYGKDYIVEPNYDPASEKPEGVTPNPGYLGTNADTTLSLDGKTIIINKTTQVEVARWPIVRYIYTPDYRPWFSPWHYSYYPPWWRPWRPFYWHYYWGFHYNNYPYYYGHYRRWHHYRNEPGRNYYYNSMRSASTVVLNRKREGGYRRTYARPDMRNDGIARYNRTYRSGLTKRSEGRLNRTGTWRAGTNRTGSNRPAVITPGRGMPGHARSKPATVTPGTGNPRKSTPAVGRPGNSRSREGRGQKEKGR
jgi:hypothetical protein